MSDPKAREQVRRLKALLKYAHSALDDIYQRRGEGSPEMKATLALDYLDSMKKWEDTNE